MMAHHSFVITMLTQRGSLGGGGDRSCTSDVIVRVSLVTGDAVGMVEAAMRLH